MARASVFVTTLMLVYEISTAVHAQARRGTGASQPVDLVEVVGCLASASNSWQLINATDPSFAKSASTTAESVKAAEAKQLGKQRYVLIGLNQLDPANHQGHKMAVKGLLIKDVKETRINVTSFQMASANCAK